MLDRLRRNIFFRHTLEHDVKVRTEIIMILERLTDAA